MEFRWLAVPALSIVLGRPSTVWCAAAQSAEIFPVIGVCATSDGAIACVSSCPTARVTGLVCRDSSPCSSAWVTFLPASLDIFGPISSPLSEKVGHFKGCTLLGGGMPHLASRPVTLSSGFRLVACVCAGSVRSQGSDVGTSLLLDPGSPVVAAGCSVPPPHVPVVVSTVRSGLFAPGSVATVA